MGNAPSGITPSRRRVAQGLERFDALLIERKERCVELCIAMMHPRAYLLQERTMARRRDELREYRITMEAIVDAYNSDERAMDWYYYLNDKMKVPFKAHCRFARPISVLKVKEEVEVLGMAPEEECESEMFVWVRQTDARIAVPLGELQPLSKNRETQEAVGDWLYWLDRGYEL